jgi:DNA-binding IclR family transcriptional regulator
MIHIANYGGTNLHSNEVARKLDLPVSSIARALTTLVEKDYIEKISEDYRLIVPVYKILLATK